MKWKDLLEFPGVEESLRFLASRTSRSHVYITV